MPETTVDEDYFPTAGKDYVRATGKGTAMKAVTVTERMHNSPDDHLRLGIPAVDPGHASASLLLRQYIHHNPRVQCNAMTGKRMTISDRESIEAMSDEALTSFRWQIEREMRRRQLRCSVGDLGEALVIELYRATPPLPKLQRSPRGTKNVDALSRNGDRYSIKTLWDAKKTGTVYPDRVDRDKQLFEFLIVACLNDELALEVVYEFTWQQFVNVRKWDKRMSAWYVGASQRTFRLAREVYRATLADAIGTDGKAS